VEGGTLAEGVAADITLLAPDLGVRIEAAKLVSKSKNTPFDGWELKGAAAATIVGGRIVYLNQNVGWADGWRTDVSQG
jgi:dihydroorotase